MESRKRFPRMLAAAVLAGVLGAAPAWAEPRSYTIDPEHFAIGFQVEHLGYADIIVDLVQTGTTLRENHLKALPDGVIVESQACLVGNRRALRDNPTVLDAARVMLEHIDAAIQGHGFSQVTVNLHGDSLDDIARQIAANPITRGLQGPTVAPIHGTESGWHTVTIIISNGNLLRAVEYLRQIGATQCVVVPVRSIFLEESPTFARLRNTLGM